jgi:hypothetical protein
MTSGKLLLNCRTQVSEGSNAFSGQPKRQLADKLAVYNNQTSIDLEHLKVSVVM